MIFMAIAEAVAPSKAVSQPVIDPQVRRFELPDLDRHGGWLMARFLGAFPHLNARQAQGFLKGMVYSNEYLFLYQDHGCALAQVMSDHVLAGQPVIWERFVWIEDPEDAMQQEAASYFYEHIYKWAKRQGVETIIVEEMSDVPHELVKTRLGRVFVREQKFARV